MEYKKPWHYPVCIYCKKPIKLRIQAGGMTTVKDPEGDLEHFHWSCHYKKSK